MPYSSSLSILKNVNEPVVFTEVSVGQQDQDQLDAHREDLCMNLKGHPTARSS